MNPIKLMLLACFAPRFFADMPPRGGGRYLAGAEKYSRFYCHPPHELEVFGRRRAYVAARWLALMLDWNCCTKEVGIRWFVRRIENAR